MNGSGLSSRGLPESSGAGSHAASLCCPDVSLETMEQFDAALQGDEVALRSRAIVEQGGS